MMKPIGKSLITVAIVILALGANLAASAVTATVDRNRLTLGDTLRLTLTVTDDEEISDSQLQALQQDFDILQRGTSSNTSIVNGRFSHSQQVTLELAPRREGNLQIPAMQFGQSTTASISVVVGAPSETPAEGQSVVVEAEVDKDTVYVQGQVILTLRVQQAVNLEGRSLTPLKLDNAFVKPLEQHSFQRVINGRQWLVDEVRYAIFPEQSGTLEIPAQVFAGRLSDGRRSIFDIGGSGQLVRRSSQPVSINVLPKPSSYPPVDWLPAQQLTIEETWSSPPAQLQVGESATRTIRIVGEGLQGAQLPPILFTPIDGLKYYPDQPTISEQEVPSGIQGVREDSAAIVPTRAGTYTIPEIRIPWWNTETGELQYAVLPERTVTATGAEPSSVSNNLDTANAPSNTGAAAAPSAAVDLAGTIATEEPASLPVLRALQLWGTVSTLGWVLTLIYLWRKRSPREAAPLKTTETQSESKAFKALINACGDSNPATARTAVIAWAATVLPGAPAVSLEQVAQRFQDKELKQLLGELDAALYRPGNDNWSGTGLAACVRRLRAAFTNTKESRQGQPIQLYPSTP